MMGVLRRWANTTHHSHFARDPWFHPETASWSGPSLRILKLRLFLARQGTRKSIRGSWRQRGEWLFISTGHRIYNSLASSAEPVVFGFFPQRATAWALVARRPSHLDRHSVLVISGDKRF